MAERITKCPKCDSRNFKDLTPQLCESTSDTIWMKAKCNECGFEFEYNAWTYVGERAREWGHIL